MKTKLEMAHEYAIALINSDCEMQFDKFIQLCWNYADAMQAEVDKREKEEAAQRRKEIREMLNAPNTFVEREGQHFDDVEEWQPDWSQAPEHANTWQKSSANNYYWCCDDDCLGAAPSFGYTGDWRESLRKRPK